MLNLKNFIPYAYIFLIGGFLYCFIELIYRGFTHPSMFLAGGAALLLIDIVTNDEKFNPPVIIKAIYITILITGIELVVGLFVNVKYGMGVWDYSNLPFNFRGQICMYFSLLWIILSLVAMFLDKLMRKYVIHA